MNDPRAPPPKRPRGESVNLGEEDVPSYEEGATRLAAKEKPKKKRLRKLMEATFSGRRVLINDETPSVSTVLQKFPPLKKPKHVSHAVSHSKEPFLQRKSVYQLIHEGVPSTWMRSSNRNSNRTSTVATESNLC